MHRAVALAAVGGITAGALLSAPAHANTDQPGPVVGLVVTREPGTSALEAQRAVEQVLDEQTTRTPVAAGVTGIAVELTHQEATAAAAQLQKQPGIAEVALDTRVHADTNDTLYGQQWSLTEPVSGANPQAAWDLTTGTGAVVAIIDSGITAHPDLDGQSLPGYDFVTDPIVANDGDGRDADPSDPGDWVDSADMAAHPGTFSRFCLADSSWHGSHVAGLVAAAQNNAQGITGVAPGAKLLPVRALGKCGGKMSDVAAAITWASGGTVPGVPVNPNPADVINLSLSSTIACEPFVQNAVDDAISRGSVVVASAGNVGAPITGYSPAGCYDVLAVGAVNRQGVRPTYSNYGVDGRDLPLFAAGGDRDGDKLISTVNTGTRGPETSAYAAYAGTSMAAPLVSGAAALLAARGTMTPVAIMRQLRSTARPFPPGGNCYGSCGAGILDVSRAVIDPPRLPGPVTGLAVRPGEGSLALEWNAPGDSGTGPLTGYSVEYRTLSGNWTSADGIWSTTMPKKVIVGLTNGVAYQVRVAARTDFGAGPWVESGAVTPVGLPGQVRIRSVRYPTKTTAKVGLTLPQADLQGLQFRLLTPARPDPAWRDERVSATLRISVQKGVRSTLQVRAVNVAGASAITKRAVATPVRPGAVRGLALNRRGALLIVKWRAPKRTGLYPAYRVRMAGGAWKRTKATHLSLRAGSGPVLVEVQTRNEVGRGPVVVKRK